jgi:hypothetical protein
MRAIRQPDQEGAMAIMSNLKSMVSGLLLIVPPAMMTIASGPVHAAEWKIEVAENWQHTAILPETRKPAPDGLPDGLVATATSASDIAAAWYTQPTRRYRHAILGDDIEAGALTVRTVAGEELAYVLPSDEVFEDRYPRLADLDGDGTTEVVTIRSSSSAGASVTVYGVRDAQVVELATTGFIGRANRWLNIAGIAAFAASGEQQIAFVTTPHIGGTLHLYAYRDGSLHRLDSRYGFSNHEIGSREMRLSVVTDVDADGRLDMVLPSADRHEAVVVHLSGGKIVERQRIKLPARIDKAIALDGTAIILGLDDGRVYRLLPR